MKRAILILIVGIVFIGSNVFADDVVIDGSGNVKTGVSSPIGGGNLDVTGASGEHAILGSASGTGAAGVYGVSTDNNDYGILGYTDGIDRYGVFGYSLGGYAGYFDGNVHLTGDLTLDGTLSGESDPVFSVWDKSTGIFIVESQITDLNHFNTGDETDPTVNALGKASLSCTNNQVAKWNGTLWACADDDVGSGGGIPSGFSILGDTPAAPVGYTFTGKNLLTTEVWATRAPMPTQRDQSAAGVVNGKIYVIGGLDGSGYLTTNEEYDPVANAWTTRAPMPTPRRASAAGAVNGKIYVIGGYDSSGYLTTNEEYDPVANAWTTRAPMPTPRRSSAAGVVNGKIYVISGFDISGDLTTNEEYDPVANTWTTVAPMPTPRRSSAAGVVNGKIYVITGLNGGDLTTNEEYDPLANAWTTRASIPTSRRSPTAGVENGKIYVIGGHDSSGYLTTNEEYFVGDIYYVHRKD